MSDSIRSAWLWLPVALLAAWLWPAAAARAAAGVEDELKAGFVLNFTKYTEWPAGVSSGNELLICAIEPLSLSGRLQSLHERRIPGHAIRVLTPTRPSEWTACHVLFIDANARFRPEAVLRALAQEPVLTVSDAPGFVQAGGMIGLKLRGGRMRFDINQGAVRAAGLALSSQLLKLADTVVP